MKTERIDRRELDDKVAINMLLLPFVTGYFFGAKIGLAVGLFYFFNYIFLIKFYFIDEDIRSYKRMSAVWIFIVIYTPLIIFLFFIGEFA